MNKVKIPKDTSNYSAKRQIKKGYDLEGKTDEEIQDMLLIASEKYAKTIFLDPVTNEKYAKIVFLDPVTNEKCLKMIYLTPVKRKKETQFPIYIRIIEIPGKISEVSEGENKRSIMSLNGKKLKKLIFNFPHAFIFYYKLNNQKYAVYVPRAEIIDEEKQEYNCKKRVPYWEVSGEQVPDWWPHERHINLDQILNDSV